MPYNRIRKQAYHCRVLDAQVATNYALGLLGEQMARDAQGLRYIVDVIKQ